MIRQTFTHCLLVLLFQMSLAQNIIFHEDFENGTGLWSASNGIFEVGIAGSGIVPHSGNQLAATILQGNYPTQANSRFTSPPIVLPEQAGMQQLKLSFWHYFEHGFVSESKLQLSTNNGMSWIDLSEPFDDFSGVWTRYLLDISAYAGQTIQIGFFFESSIHQTELGYYLDDVLIVQEEAIFTNPESFEGLHDWNVSNGLWEVGGGICSSPYDSSLQFSTVHCGTYPVKADSRLESPVIQLPNDPGLLLQVWHKFDFGFVAEGRIQISVNGGTWQDLSGSFEDSSPTWTQYVASLGSYVGQKIQIGFRMESSIHQTAGGWEVDWVKIVGMPVTALEEDMLPVTALSIAPNPMVESCRISIELEQATKLGLRITDGLGRQIWAIEPRSMMPGLHEFGWNGFTSDGKRLPDGIYILLVETPHRAISDKIVMKP
ncbi:MAG: choice-of-anchor J domain-containing protein [Bacteroidota bacterium]